MLQAGAEGCLYTLQVISHISVKVPCATFHQKIPDHLMYHET
jgi:hypothetical protein